jgi:hypothetical protein
MSQLEVNKVLPQSGTTLTLGESGDTISIPSGATLDASNATLTLPDDSVTTAKIDDGAVTNAKVDASAAIAYSKLNLATSIVNADISTTAAIATTKLGAGAVLQVVTATDSTERTTTSTSFVTGTISLNITPTSASSKILLLYSTAADGADGQNTVVVTLLRGATNLAGSNGMSQSFPRVGGVGINHLDSPNTTSEITYTVNFKLLSGVGSVEINYNGTQGNLTALEIAG